MIKILLTIILYFSISGYSIIGKKLFLNKNNSSQFNNFDIFIGIFFLTFLSLILNLFFPLKIFNGFIIILGLIFFLYFFNKTNFNLSFIYLFILIIFFNLIININQLATDSQVYHLQIIKWYNEYKTILGLSNIQIRFAMNSSWHHLLSLMHYEYKSTNTIYLINLIPLIALFSEIFYMKKNNFFKLSNKFLISCAFFILIFSTIHPAQNGPILNMLGSPEVDIIGMVLFILCFYYFLQFFENKNSLNYFYLFLISILCISIKLSYILCILLFLITIFLYKKFFFENFKVLIILILFSFVWMLNSFFNSGCLIFPIRETCFNVIWSLDIEAINYFKNYDATAFLRSKNNPVSFTNKEYYLDSFKWFYPWVKNYLITSSFFLINIFIILLSSSIIILNKSIFKKKIDAIKIYLGLIAFVIIFLIFWSMAPEFRYVLGIVISISSFIFAIAISIYQSKIIKWFYLINISLILLMSINLLKNFNQIFIKSNQFYAERHFDYSNFIFLSENNNFKFFYSETRCAYFMNVCVYDKENQYLEIKKKNGYYIFSKTN
jgi:hypothetical protein